MSILPPGLLRNRSLNLAITLTLTLAMAAAMVVSGLLDAFLAQPLPHINDKRVVVVAEVDPQSPQNRTRITWNMAQELRQRAESFEQFAIVSNAAYTVHGHDNTEVAYIPRVSPELFTILGVQAQLGSVITPANWASAGQSAFLLSDSLWQRRFARDPEIVGRSIRLDDQNVTVVGVLPAGFELNILGTGQQGWVAMDPSRFSETRGNFTRHFAFARLAEGVSARQADSEVARLGAHLREQGLPTSNQELVVSVQSLRDSLLGDFRQQLWILLFLAVLVLTVGCLNCTALWLTQGLHRRREFAVRQALGANSWRLALQFWTENIFITMLAAGGAVLIAAWSGPALIELLPARAGANGFSLPRPSANVMGVAFLAAILLAGIFAAVPWLIARHLPLEATLRSGGRHAAAGFAGRAGPWLVSAQVMAAFILSTGAFTLVKSGQELSQTDFGFPIDELYQFRVSVRGEAFTEMEERERFFANVRREVAALPEVTTASSAFLSFPQPLTAGSQFVQREDSFPLEDSPKQASMDAVSPAFFQTHDLPALHGRTFNSSDRADTRPVAIITAALAERYWPDRSPVGQEILLQRTGGDVWREIVGVIPDRLSSGHQPEIIHSVLVPLTQFTPTGTALFVRHGPTGPPMFQTLQRVVWNINPDASIFFESAVADFYAESAWQQRFSTMLLVGFASLAVALCAAGLFAVLSFSVASRDRELGIRSALGATTADLCHLIFRGASKIIITGLIGGVLLSLFALRSIEGLVYNVPTLSPTSFILVAAGMSLLCLLAAWMPARHAGKTDPIVALRQD